VVPIKCSALASKEATTVIDDILAFRPSFQKTKKKLNLNKKCMKRGKNFTYSGNSKNLQRQNLNNNTKKSSNHDLQNSTIGSSISSYINQQ